MHSHWDISAKPSLLSSQEFGFFKIHLGWLKFPYLFYYWHGVLGVAVAFNVALFILNSQLAFMWIYLFFFFSCGFKLNHSTQQRSSLLFKSWSHLFLKCTVYLLPLLWSNHNLLGWKINIWLNPTRAPLWNSYCLSTGSLTSLSHPGIYLQNLEGKESIFQWMKTTLKEWF